MPTPTLGLYRTTEDLVRRYFTLPSFPEKLKAALEKSPRYVYRGQRLKDCIWLLGQLDKGAFFAYAKEAYRETTYENVSYLFNRFYQAQTGGFTLFTYQINHGLSPLAPELDKKIQAADLLPASENAVSQQRALAHDQIQRDHPTPPQPVTPARPSPGLTPTVPLATPPLSATPTTPAPATPPRRTILERFRRTQPSVSAGPQPPMPPAAPPSLTRIPPLPPTRVTINIPEIREETARVERVPVISTGRAPLPFARTGPVRGAASQGVGRAVSAVERGAIKKGAASAGLKLAGGALGGPPGWILSGLSLIGGDKLLVAGVKELFNWKLWVGIFIGLLLVLALVMDLNEKLGLLPPIKQNISGSGGGSLGSGSGGGGSSSVDLSACKFYRDPQPPTQYGSPLLLRYFNEASNKSGIPAVLLAAFAKVETNATYYTDTDVLGMDEGFCTRNQTSPTGALGLMQIQPPPRINPNDPGAYYQQGVELGAKFLGTTADELTHADFCDPQKSIILASGFIIKKTRALLSQPGDTWDPAWLNNKNVIDDVARGYYGCLLYDSCTTGPNSYGDDLWKSLQGCKVEPTIAISGEGGERIANAAQQIAGQLLHSVRDRDKIDNIGLNCAVGAANGDANGHYTGYHCWSEMAKAAYDFAKDPDYLQCTEFVFAALDKAGYGEFAKKLMNSNARDYADTARSLPSDFQVITDARKVQPGDIISVGDDNTFGHVAIVIRKDEGNQIEVVQSATDYAFETWNYDPDTGKLIPAFVQERATRRVTPRSGFIRLNTSNL